MTRNVWFALMVLVRCCFVPALAEETHIIFVDDFEAANDRERINLALSHVAALDGRKELRFTERTYQLDVPQDDDPFSAIIGVDGVSDLIIDGQGAMLVATNALEKTRGYVFKCARFENLTVKNLTLTFNPLPFIQGVITSVDQPANRVSLRLDPDFDHIDALRLYQHAEYWCRVGLKQNPLHPKPASPSWLSVGTDEAGRIARQEQDDGSISLQAGFIDQSNTLNAEMNWESGDPMVVWLRSGLDGFYFEEGRGLVLDNLAVHAVPHYAIKVRGVEQVHISTCRVVPGPGAMFSSSADGIDVQQSRDVLIEGCRLMATGDDAISFLNHGHGVNGMVRERKFPPPWPETNEDVVIRDNHIEGGNRNAILLLAHDAEVTANTVLHTRQYGVKFTGDRTRIAGNVFREVGTFAAYRHILDELNTGIIGSDEWIQRDVIINDNLIEDWRNMPGILLKSVHGAEVTGNRFIMNDPGRIATLPFNSYLTYVPAICVTHGQGGKHPSKDLHIDKNAFSPADWLPGHPAITPR